MSFMQDMVSKFNRQADSHSKSQSLNPYSEQFVQSRSPSPRFSREEYGKPVAGSKTDLRGRKAKTHICREILELCTVIHDVGTYKAQKRVPGSGGGGDDDDDIEDDGTIIVSFGELFQIYTKISDKVVGLLIAAKRRGFVYFDREILFQRRDDDVLIALLKPISEINKILKEVINQANGVPPPVAEAKPAEKTKPAKTKRAKSVTAGQEPNDVIAVNGVVAVAADKIGETADETAGETAGETAAEIGKIGETAAEIGKIGETTAEIGKIGETPAEIGETADETGRQDAWVDAEHDAAAASADATTAAEPDGTECAPLVVGVGGDSDAATETDGIQATGTTPTAEAAPGAGVTVHSNGHH